MKLINIHTIELALKINEEMYNTLSHRFFELAKGNKRSLRIRNEYMYEQLFYLGHCNNGVKFNLKRGNFIPYYISAVVSLKTVLEKGDLTHTFNPNEESLIEVLAIVDEQFQATLNMSVYEFELTRIDLVIDIKFQDENLVKEYIRLARKGGIPKGYRNTYLDDYSNAYNVTNNSNGNMFTLYDKEAQLINIKKEKDAIEMKGVLRMEQKLSYEFINDYIWSRCFEIHEDIKSTDEYTRILSLKEKLDIIIEKSYEIILESVDSIFFNGEYIKLEAARKKIESLFKNNEFRDAKTIKLRLSQAIILYLDKIAKSQDYSRIKADKQEFYYQAREKIEAVLRTLNINPVTISSRHKVDKLKSFICLVEEYGNDID